MAICVIGAGPAGLTAAKNLAAHKIAFTCFEKEEDIGGIWNAATSQGRVFETTHMISSKRLTEFHGFRFPHSFPHFPSHVQALNYLKSYSNEFDLTRHIRLGTSVQRIEPIGNQWRVECLKANVSDAQLFDGVIVASGHHSIPRWPEWRDEFVGECIHSSQYKNADILRGKRVLIVGAGNSGCDIAVEAAQHASRGVLSLRRGYHVLPKYLFGAPIDRCGATMHRWRIPLWLQRWILKAALHVAIGPLDRYTWPTAEHRVLESHPIINSHVLHMIAHGRLATRPDVQSVLGDQVQFVDGQSESFDLLICATGYETRFPFCDPALLGCEEPSGGLFLNAFHPRYDNLFMVGLIQPNGGIWQLADYQAQLIAQVIEANQRGTPAADWFRHQKRNHHRVAKRYRLNYIDSPRHAIEVEYFAYRNAIRKYVCRMGKGGGGSRRF